MLDQLPLELVIALYGYLSHTDQKSVRQTCSKCYRASSAFSLINSDVLIINKRILKPACKSIVECLKSTDRKYVNLIISELTPSDYLWVIEKFGPSLKTLTFKKCDINIIELAGVISKLEYLEELKVVACSPLWSECSSTETGVQPKVELNRLKYLEISDTSYLTDKALSKFCALCSTIVHLSIKATSLNVHIGVHNFNYKANMDILQNPSDNVFTIQYFATLVKSRAKNIRGLNLSNTLINNNSLKELLQTAFLKLNSLNLANCRELRFDPLMFMGHWQPQITDLNLSNCHLITNNLLSHVCGSMPNIRILNLSSNDSFNDEGFSNLTLLNSLQELDISNCENISSEGIREVIAIPKRKVHMKILRMSRSKITDYDLIYLLCNLYLTELDISFCTHLTDVFLKTLFISQKSLKILKLAATEITDTGVTEIEETELRLPNINLEKYENMEIFSPHVQHEIITESLFYYDICKLNNSYYKLENLSCLTNLDLSRCSNLTDYLFTIPLRLPNLRKLSLCSIKDITSKAIMILVHGCSSLEDLDLTGTHVTDIGVFVLANRLHRLKHLCLRNCWTISDKALFYIKQNCKSLITLDVLGCNVTQKMLNEIKNLPSLSMVIGLAFQSPSLGFSLPNAPPLPLNF